MNLRPLRPERSALPNCATPRVWKDECYVREAADSAGLYDVSS